MWYFTEIYYLETEEDPIIFSHASYGRIITRVAYLDNITFSYGIAAAFDNQTYFNSCAVVFADNAGYLIATTKFISRYNSVLVKIQCIVGASLRHHIRNLTSRIYFNCA